MLVHTNNPIHYDLTNTTLHEYQCLLCDKFTYSFKEEYIPEKCPYCELGEKETK